MPARPPTEKALYAVSTSLSSSERKEMQALSTAVIAIPAIITVPRNALMCDAIPTITSVVINAPAKAPICKSTDALGKKVNITIQQKPAPEFTPIMFGAASVLPVTHCKSTPETERPMPHKTAAITRGNLRFRIMIKAVSVSLPISCMISALPKAQPRIIDMHSSGVKMIMSFFTCQRFLSVCLQDNDTLRPTAS